MNGQSGNTFEGAINTDIAPTNIRPNDYIYALNIENGMGNTVGRVTNMRGNELVVFALPAGTNTCVGTYEDKQNFRVIYFVANSNNQDSIIAYYPLEQRTELLAQGAMSLAADKRVNHISLVNNQLAWTDGHVGIYNEVTGNPPRLLNIERSALNKALSYELFAGRADESHFVTGTTYSIEITDLNGNVITPTTQILLITSDLDLTTGYADLSAAMEPYVGSIEACECSIIFTAYNNQRVIVTSSANDIIVTPTNHLTNPLQVQHFDLIKTPPVFEPQVTYSIDNNVLANYVTRSVFQFRVRYIYRDGQKSAWGPISVLPLALGLDGSVLEIFNYILVDFTDPKLSDPAWLCIISDVEIAFRTSNTDIFKSIDVIPVCRVGRTNQQLKFYNDQLYTPVPSDDTNPDSTTQVLKPYDNVPRITGALTAISDDSGNNRLVTGANLENYNAPDCTEMYLAVTPEDANECRISIKGKLFFYDNLVNLSDMSTPFRHMIDYNMLGCPVYLAGTPYFGISQTLDTNVNGSFEIAGVPKGIYKLRVASPKCNYGYNNPPSQSYNLDNSTLWQKTSAPVIDCAGATAAGEYWFERTIDLRNFVGTVYDLDTELDDNGFPYGEIKVANLRPGLQGTTDSDLYFEIYNFIPEGLFDANNEEISGQDWDTISGALPAELQYFDASWLNVPGNPVPTGDFDYYNHPSRTDCNGYYWLESYGNFTVFDGEISNFRMYSEMVYDDICNNPDLINVKVGAGASPGDAKIFSILSTWQGVDTQTATVQIFDFYGLNCNPTYNGGNNLAYEAMYYLKNDSPGAGNIKDLNRTLVKGTVTDENGLPLEGAVVVISGGRWQLTNNLGQYSITLMEYASGDGTGIYGRDGDIQITYLQDACYLYPPIDDNAIQTFSLDFCGDYNYTTLFYTADTVEYSFSLIDIISVGRHLKVGGNYNFGIVYEDEFNRKATVSKMNGSLRIPYFTEVGLYYKPEIEWAITSRPPEWAHHYRIVRTKETSYLRYLVWSPSNIKYAILADASAVPQFTSYAAGDYTHILIQASTNYLPDATDASTIMFYKTFNQIAFEAQPLDKIRFIADETFTIYGGGTPSLFQTDIVGRYIDNDGNYFAIIEAINVGQEIKGGCIVEFYSPKLAEDEIYYETGETYLIGDPYTDTRYHEGPIQNQTSVLPALGKLVGGDTYWREKNYTLQTGNTTLLCENIAVSDMFESTASDIGRPNVFDPDFGEKVFHNKLSFSNLYTPNSKYNGLSAFRQLDYIFINPQFGPIQKLVVTANVLLAVCWWKSQTIYAGKDSLMDLAGNTQVSRSNKVLAVANQIRGDFGTQHPESVVTDMGNTYGFDYQRGEPWVMGANGQQSISRGKYRDFSELCKNNVMQQIIGGLDRYHNEYIFTLVYDKNMSLQYETHHYSEDQNAFKKQSSQLPEAYGKMGKYLFTFKNGNLWINNSENVPYCNFFGVQYNAEIQFVSNTQPDTDKVFKNIAIHADSKWHCPEITTPKTKWYPIGQRSRLLPNKLRPYESFFCADLLRDINDNAQQFLAIQDIPLRESTALLSGRPLRGTVMTVLLRCTDPTQPSVLFRATIEYFISMNTRLQ